MATAKTTKPKTAKLGSERRSLTVLGRRALHLNGQPVNDIAEVAKLLHRVVTLRKEVRIRLVKQRLLVLLLLRADVGLSLEEPKVRLLLSRADVAERLPRLRRLSRASAASSFNCVTRCT